MVQIESAQLYSGMSTIDACEYEGAITLLPKQPTEMHSLDIMYCIILSYQLH
jgi:hypothetical protein